MNTQNNDSKNEDEDIYADMYSHIQKHGHIYGLVLIFITALYTRLQGYRNLKVDGKWVFSGNDPWYHFRATMYSVKNYPSVIGHDAKTAYPSGSNTGTFGTFFDFIHATVSMLVGFGDPSAETVKLILIISPAIITAISVLGVYKVATYYSDSRLAGLTSALILTFIPGTFYRRGIAGFADHQILESLLFIFTILLVFKAIDEAENKVIIKEYITEFNISEMKLWLIYTSGAIITMSLYFMTWPPAIMFFGIISLATVVYSLISYNSFTPLPVLLTMSIINISMFVLVILNQPANSFTLGTISYLHLFAALASFGMTVFCWGMVKLSDQKNWNRLMYSGIVSATAIVSIVLVALIQPDLFSSLIDNIARAVGLQTSESGVDTISEGRSTSITSLIAKQYGLTLVVSIMTIGYLIFESQINHQENKGYATKLILVFLSLFIILISIGTVRFNYYLAPIVAILGGIGIYIFLDSIEFPDKTDDIAGYHILAIIFAIMLVTPVLFVPLSNSTTVYDSKAQPSPTYQQWEEPLEWLSNNSESDGIGQYESYNKGFTYTNESYGVMAWWDYGHLITTTGERTPVSNPFQDHAVEAAKFLLAQNPDEAQNVMDELGEENNVEDPESKYIIIDGQTASPLSKLSALESWHPDMETGNLYEPYYARNSDSESNVQFMRRNQNYYQTMIGRLFYGHGSAMEESSYTIQYTVAGQGIKTLEPATKPIVKHNSSQTARSIAQRNPNVVVGGIGDEPPERVSALSHYRLVKTSPARTYQTRAYAYEARNIDLNSENRLKLNTLNDVPSAVKVFQKVDGADIRGTGFNNQSTVTLRVEVTDPVVQTPRSFIYHKRVNVDSDGSFNTTVPYSTTGYASQPNSPEVYGSSQYSVIGSDGNVLEQFSVNESTVVNDVEPIQVNN